MIDSFPVGFNILFIEDNPGDRDLILEHLEHSENPFSIETAESLKEARQQLNNRAFNIAMLDLGLPDSMGIDTLIQFRAHAPEIPIIVLTGLDDKEMGIEAIRNGAQDYLVKGHVTARLLIQSLLHALERHNLKGKVEHYNRVLRAIRDINQLIIRENDPIRIIRQACKILIETRGFRGVWAALGDGIAPPSDFVQAGFTDCVGSIEKQLAQGVWPPCVKNILESDRRVIPFNPCTTPDCPYSATNNQNAAGVSLLKTGGKTYGIFSVSFKTGFMIDSEEENLFREIADDIAFALHALEVKKQHQDAEEHIRRQHLFLQLLLDAIPISVFYKDTDGLFIGCNNVFANFLNKSKEEIIGKKTYDFFPKKIADRFTRTDRELLNKPGIRQYEAEVQKADNGMRNVLVNKASYHDAEGNVAGIIGAMIDVTDRKVMERCLLQSQKMESIGTLAGGIAHDFNNILSAIIGFTELSFFKAEKGSRIEKNLHEVLVATNRAKELVQRILTFARLSDEETRPIQPKLIIEEVLKFIRSSIPATIDIEQDLQSESFIMGNTTQLHQVMMNLCTNAAQSMEEKGGSLHIALKNNHLGQNRPKDLLGLTPGNYIQIEVSDNGTGIPPDIIGSIFEPYFTTKRSGEGTGLGLAMVHGIVERCNGRILVNSQPGIGTVFTIYLPVSESDQGETLYRPEVLPKGSERILVVDDEEPVAVAISEILKELGYSVKTSTSSTEALDLFQSTPDSFDLVISDMSMPKIAGDLLAIEMMKIKPEIPIILCTGYSKKISCDSAKEIGIKELVSKPITQANLAKTVRKILDNTNQQR